VFWAICSHGILGAFVGNQSGYNGSNLWGPAMQRISAREAKNGFGRLIDMARAEPVAIEKHGRAGGRGGYRVRRI
jgi:hypothetical protein